MRAEELTSAAFAGDRTPRGLRLDEVERRIDSAANALYRMQQADGHWCFELEADATIPAEYILLRHFRGEPVDTELERKIIAYLKRIQGAHGGWPLFHEGGFDMSASVKAYFALKMMREDPGADYMCRARDAILAHGGAARSNVFTRILLAQFGQIPWRGVPTMPVEIMLLPRWFPFHLSKISYWARTVLVPLLVVQAMKPQPKNPDETSIRELFTVAPEEVRDWPKGAHQKKPWSQIFGAIDVVLKRVEPYFPIRTRKRAIEAAVAFVDERLNGTDGLGAIYPAMANSVLMYDLIGVAPNDPRLLAARESLDRLLVIKEDEAYCQPCFSPVWDTALVAHALLEVGTPEAEERAREGLDWLKPLQVLDVKGDWAERKPDVRPGGWAFQYNNAHYPDLDDTAVVVMAMDRAQAKLAPAMAAELTMPIERGEEWVEGLQSRNGGWGAFDADNTYSYLNHIPFADHGALLDPPTADVTARCVSMMAQRGARMDTSPEFKRGVDNLLAEQEADGSWFGRWGMNYIYGTWSVLCALNAAGVDPNAPTIRRAVDWLTQIQNPDGGWGEAGESYKLEYQGYERAPSTATQTAWALLGLMAVGEIDHPAIDRGMAYLARTQAEDGLWPEERFNAVGFPRVFYLHYHGYPKFFPLWAMARYRNLKQGNSGRVEYGI